MTKRAGVVSEETKRSLVEEALREFHEKGFQKASLRAICQRAGLTTGALYFFFRDKDDLFREVLSRATVPFMDIIKRHYETEEEGGAVSDEEASVLAIGVYMANRESFEVLIHNQDHPAAREFFSSFVTLSLEHYEKRLKDMGIASPDRTALEAFLRMQLAAMLFLVSRNFGEERLIREARSVTRMLQGAMGALIGK